MRAVKSLVKIGQSSYGIIVPIIMQKSMGFTGRERSVILVQAGACLLLRREGSAPPSLEEVESLVSESLWVPDPNNLMTPAVREVYDLLSRYGEMTCTELAEYLQIDYSSVHGRLQRGLAEAFFMKENSKYRIRVPD